MSDWLDEFTETATVPVPKARPFRNLLGFFTLPIVMGVTLAGAATPSVALPGAVINGSVDYWNNLPDNLPKVELPQHARILAADGSLIADFYSENRLPIKNLSQVNPIMVRALLSSEDARFYGRGPIDIKGVVRSARNGSGGGSTITQQYVKNLLLNAATNDEQRKAAVAPTLDRKVRELNYAVRVEQTMAKDQILVGYLNIAYFGDGAYGIGAAARRYFSTDPAHLTVPQAAMLAGLVQSPDAMNPVQHPKAATARRNLVLGRMVATKTITAAQAAAFKKAPLGLKVSVAANGCADSPYPFYCSMVRETLQNDPAFGPTPQARAAWLYRGGLTIRTALDTRLMKQAAEAVYSAFGKGNEYAGATALVQPGTGKVLAVAQSRGWKETQVNYATSGFQNGSTFKPVTLAAAMQNGWDPLRVVNAKYRHCAPRPYTGCFRNSSRADAGPMNSVTATARSSNTFYTQLYVSTGGSKVQALARALGWTFPEGTGGHETSTTLGTYNVSPLVVSNAYATFAAHGVYCTPRTIMSITDRAGKKVDVPQGNCRQVISPDVADKVTNIMTEVVDGKDGARTGKGLSIGRAVAGKTGTTENNTAVWFAGMTPGVASAVWVGDPEGGFAHPVRNIVLYGKTMYGAAYGATVAGPVWRDIMARAVAGTPARPFSVPASLPPGRVVPDVRGMTLPAAVDAMRSANIEPVIGSPMVDPDAPVDTVVAQSVKPGSPVGVARVSLSMQAGSRFVTIVDRPGR